jgi:hypothetical protein
MVALHEMFLTCGLFYFSSIDFVIVPLKILQSLQEAKALKDDKYSFSRRLSSAEAETFNFTEQEVGGTPGPL